MAYKHRKPAPLGQLEAQTASVVSDPAPDRNEKEVQQQQQQQQLEGSTNGSPPEHPGPQVGLVIAVRKEQNTANKCTT